MTLAAAETLARDLMRLHRLGRWTFGFDRAPRRFGSCHQGKKRITLSAPIVELNDEAAVRDTILHEIAHALTPSDPGHGWRWRWMAKSIGAKPTPYTDEGVRDPAPTWIAQCPNCLRELKRLRRNRTACARCCDALNGGQYTDAFRYHWRRAGEPSTIGPNDHETITASVTSPTAMREAR